MNIKRQEKYELPISLKSSNQFLSGKVTCCLENFSRCLNNIKKHFKSSALQLIAAAFSSERLKA